MRRRLYEEEFGSWRRSPSKIAQTKISQPIRIEDYTNSLNCFDDGADCLIAFCCCYCYSIVLLFLCDICDRTIELVDLRVLDDLSKFLPSMTSFKVADMNVKTVTCFHLLLDFHHSSYIHCEGHRFAANLAFKS